MPSWFRKLRSLSRPDATLLVEATAFLALARVRSLRAPFRDLAAALGRLDAEAPGELPAGQEALARRVGWAVQAMARRIPWNGLCLTQALAAGWMLRRRAVPFTLYLGTRPDPGGKPVFHAWLRSGACRVTGGGGCERYQVLARFGSGAPGAGTAGHFAQGGFPA
jgi:hypothetical protein